MTVKSARRLLLIIAIVLIALDIGAVALLFSPVGRGRTAREEAYNQVRQEYQAKMRAEGPARDIDKRIADAHKQIGEFYQDRLPSRYSEISDTIGKLASENHVQVATVRYDAKDSDVAGLQRIDITAQVTGDYNNQMRFINALERAKTFFVIDSVNLGGAETGGVRLEMKLETFKKGAA